MPGIDTGGITAAAMYAQPGGRSVGAAIGTCTRSFRMTLGVAAAILLPCAIAQGAKPTGEERIEPTEKQMMALQALNPEIIAQGVAIADDDLEPTATISTVNAYQSRGGFTDKVRADNYLRAFIDKRTGATRYQLYQTVRYMGPDRAFQLASYATPSGPVPSDLRELGHNVVSCAGTICVRDDTLAFELSRPTLALIASQYVAGSSPPWRFRFKGQTGMDWEDRMMPAEVKALLLAVDRYRTAHGLPAVD
jgi:hypothetical protein